MWWVLRRSASSFQLPASSCSHIFNCWKLEAGSWKLFQSESNHEIKTGPQRAADERRDDGDPRVLPVRASLAGDGQHRVREARREIAGRVDRVPRRSTERHADAEHEDADEQRLQAAAEHEGQVDVAGGVERLR